MCVCRATTALRVTFNVPKPLQSHMEVLPHHGVVQGQSSFSAQLKFIPRCVYDAMVMLLMLYDVVSRVSIFSDCKQYFDENNMLSAPLDVQVAEQVVKR